MRTPHAGPDRSSLRARLHGLDQRTWTWVHRRRWPAVDNGMHHLSAAADFSRLWLAIAALLALTRRRRARRAAVRGLVSVAGSSLLANVVVKPLARRRRPDHRLVELERVARRRPRSSSFPSGHTSSAAAFATGVALEQPALGLPLGVLAGAVGYSRVHNGAHYPGDVLAGALLGITVAVGTRRVWPVAPEEAAVARRRGSPAAERVTPDGSGVTMLVNPSAGPILSASSADELRTELPGAVVVEVSEGADLGDLLAEAAGSAAVIGIAGGDGSVAAAAQIALEAGKPLLVVPAGTLNHFCRDLGVDGVADAVRALRRGETAAVDVATASGQVFLNTFSLGSYTELVDRRERLEGRIGKWPAVVVALAHVLREADAVDIELDGARRRVWTVFVGNCRYHPSGFTPSWRERLDDGLLDIRVIDAGQPFARTRLLLAVLTGRLGRCRAYEQRVAPTLRIRSADGSPLRIARDGETADAPADLLLAKAPHGLDVYAPGDD